MSDDDDVKEVDYAPTIKALKNLKQEIEQGKADNEKLPKQLYEIFENSPFKSIDPQFKTTVPQSQRNIAWYKEQIKSCTIF